LTKIENDIANLEKDISNIDSDLTDSKKYDQMTSDPDFFSSYQAKKDKVEVLMQDWEKLHQLIEN